MTNSTPPIVAMKNEHAPSTKIPSVLGVRKTDACVEAPTVMPIRIVMMSISWLLAVVARRFTTPDSFRRLPKKSIPSSGIASGTTNVVSRKPMIGKRIFSVEETARGGRILIRRSRCEVSRRITGGWITGTRAMYE